MIKQAFTMPSVKTQNQPIQTFMLLLWSGWMMTYPFLQVWKRWIVTQSFLNFASLVKNICHLYIIKETQECQSHRGELQSTAFQWEIRSCLYYGYIYIYIPFIKIVPRSNLQPQVVLFIPSWMKNTQQNLWEDTVAWKVKQSRQP